MFSAFYLFTIAVEESFDVLLTLANPFAFDLWYVNHHNVTSRQTRQLIDRLRLTSTWRTIEQTSKTNKRNKRETSSPH